MISHHSNPVRQAWIMVGLLRFAAFLNYLDRMILITMRSSINVVFAHCA
jgi:hypothetical protein